MAIPSLLYGTETWILKTKDKIRVQPTKLRFIRGKLDLITS